MYVSFQGLLNPLTFFKAIKAPKRGLVLELCTSSWLSTALIVFRITHISTASVLKLWFFKVPFNQRYLPLECLASTWKSVYYCLDNILLGLTSLSQGYNYAIRFMMKLLFLKSWQKLDPIIYMFVCTRHEVAREVCRIQTRKLGSHLIPRGLLRILLYGVGNDAFCSKGLLRSLKNTVCVFIARRPNRCDSLVCRIS